MQFVWRHDADTGYLDLLKLALTDTHEHVTMTSEVLKKTVVTVTLVNQNTKLNDRVDGNYVRMLDVTKHHKGTISFRSFQFIHINDMFANKETGTCFFGDGKFEFIIDLYLPHVVPFKH
ncbi:MAG: hypothetical protein K0U78_12860 [Actinomycetia bacterium]|nr:hypothetical protein [Actinomycetes bacterium]